MPNPPHSFRVSAFLSVTDIAGLIRGASEGAGLGNAFLSHIRAVDAIFHVSRAFEDEEVVHVDGMNLVSLFLLCFALLCFISIYF